MSRNHVSKVLCGIDTANTNAAQKNVEALTDRQLIAYDYDTGIEIVATTKNIAFARGTANLGEALVAGPIPIAGITTAILNPFKAAVNKEMTLTVTAVPTVGKVAIIRVSYHDNLSIIPNQIKQTVIGIEATTTNTATTTTFAAAITAEFNKQLGTNLFVTITSAANVVTFVGIVLTTQSNYNGIDRPETINFEIGAPTNEAEFGIYAIAQSVALAIGQGDASKVAWIEEQSMGRFGFSDRRLWNDTKKYPSQVVAGETYDVLVITADVEGEGDMQGVIKHPIGAVLCGESDTLALVLVDLAVAGVVPLAIPAG